MNTMKTSFCFFWSYKIGAYTVTWHWLNYRSWLVTEFTGHWFLLLTNDYTVCKHSKWFTVCYITLPQCWPCHHRHVRLWAFMSQTLLNKFCHCLISAVALTCQLFPDSPTEMTKVKVKVKSYFTTGSSWSIGSSRCQAPWDSWSQIFSVEPLQS